jgi:hypothetical protein
LRKASSSTVSAPFVMSQTTTICLTVSSAFQARAYALTAAKSAK